MSPLQKTSSKNCLENWIFVLKKKRPNKPLNLVSWPPVIFYFLWTSFFLRKPTSKLLLVRPPPPLVFSQFLSTVKLNRNWWWRKKLRCSIAWLYWRHVDLFPRIMLVCKSSKIGSKRAAAITGCAEMSFRNPAFHLAKDERNVFLQNVSKSEPSFNKFSKHCNSIETNWKVPCIIHLPILLV